MKTYSVKKLIRDEKKVPSRIIRKGKSIAVQMRVSITKYVMVKHGLTWQQAKAERENDRDLSIVPEYQS